MSEERISARRLVGFLGEKRRLAPIAGLLVLGLALMLSGGASPRGDDERSLERRVEELCGEIGGVGEPSVMVTLTEDGSRVLGAAVVCVGGDSPEAQLKLTRLLCALFGIGSDSVSVVGAGE